MYPDLVLTLLGVCAMFIVGASVVNTIVILDKSDDNPKDIPEWFLIATSLTIISYFVAIG